MNCSHNKRREISVMYEISTRTLQRYVDAYNECGMDAEPQGGLTYGLLPTTEDRATLGSDLSAGTGLAKGDKPLQGIGIALWKTKAINPFRTF